MGIELEVAIASFTNLIHVAPYPPRALREKLIFIDHLQIPATY